MLFLINKSKRRQTQMTFFENQTVSIAIGGAVGLSCVCSEMIHAKLSSQTEKAIQISCGKESIWLPKSALEPKSDWFKLKSWFKSDKYQNRFFDKYAGISGQSSL